MKGILLWGGFVCFLWLAITAYDMGEHTIMVVMGGLAVVCAWAAPMGGKKTETSTGRSRHR